MKTPDVIVPHGCWHGGSSSALLTARQLLGASKAGKQARNEQPLQALTLENFDCQV